MSYNVAICLQPIPTNDAEAWQQLDSLIEANGHCSPQTMFIRPSADLDEIGGGPALG